MFCLMRHKANTSLYYHKMDKDFILPLKGSVNIIRKKIGYARVLANIREFDKTYGLSISDISHPFFAVLFAKSLFYRLVIYLAIRQTRNSFHL
jgi:hypothetical protein